MRSSHKPSTRFLLDMFHFSLTQRILLVFGFLLILLSASLNRVSALWDRFSREDPVVWNELTIAPGRHARISSLDETTLVMRSSANSHARLTLFIREQTDSRPGDLVKDLCGRDSCVYRPLEDERLDGAIADYVTGTPFRIVLMQLRNSNVWLEFKGPADDLKMFDNFIDAVVTQTQAQPGPADES